VAPSYVIERIVVVGNSKTKKRVVERYLPFSRGDNLSPDDPRIQRARFRLLGTGNFRFVELSLRKGTRRGAVDLVVTVEERNTIVVNDLWLGLAADASSDGRARPLTGYGGASVSENNFLGTGIGLTGAFAVADKQLALRAHITDPNLFGSRWVGELELLHNRARDFFGSRDVLVEGGLAARDYASPEYTRTGGALSIGHDVGASAQAFVGLRVEHISADLPKAASHVYGLEVQPIDFRLLRDSSYLSILRTGLVYDTRDDVALTRQGDHVLASADAAAGPLGSDYVYVKLGVRTAHYVPLKWNHTLKVEGFIGAVFGNAPLFERFYVGDFTDFLPDRALDLTFDRRSAPNFLNTSIIEQRYGDYAAKVSVEYRVPLYRGSKLLYGADAFGSLGFFGLLQQRDLERGITGYNSWSRLPVDMTLNAGLRFAFNVGTLQLGVSNFLSFLPLQGSQGAQQ
jgi:outer membrane protein assembly factor BamA